MTINIINIYYKHNINIFFLFYGMRIVTELGDFTLLNKTEKQLVRVNNLIMIMSEKNHICSLFVDTFVVPCYFYETKSLHTWYFLLIIIIRLYFSTFPCLH